MYQGVLQYGGGKYLWWALGMTLVAIVLYGTQPATAPPSGSTWQGYTLGGLGALLIIWLSLLGVRKRRYGRAVNLEAWVSGHVYFGAALVFIVLLHSSFQFGWNVHTLALVLMLLVIGSGFYGIWAYVALPRQSADARQGKSWHELLDELQHLNSACMEQARQCGADHERVVASSIERTALGGGLLQRIRAGDASAFVNAAAAGSTPVIVANANQEAVLRHFAAAAAHAGSEAEADAITRLIPLIARRQALLARLRSEMRLRALLRVWLFVHVPATVALLAAVLVHVLVVFLYW